MILTSCQPHSVTSVRSNNVLSLPQWGASDAEIKVPFGENTELKRSPFKARSNNNNNKEFLYSAIL